VAAATVVAIAQAVAATAAATVQVVAATVVAVAAVTKLCRSLDSALR
jgi:hypothetical protein